MGASLFSASQYSRRVSRHRRICGNIVDYDGAGADQRARADGQPAENCRTAADTGTAFDDGRNDLPLGVRLQCAIRARGARILVVDENDAMADKDFVFDSHPFADETMA